MSPLKAFSCQAVAVTEKAAFAMELLQQEMECVGQLNDLGS
jgi:hypothetical protein